MFISEAFAQAATGQSAGGLENAGQFLPLILIFVVFYFLLFRPQQQKVKRHKAMVSALRRGDRVVTQSGILGVVNKVINDSEVSVEIAENVKVRMLKSAVTEVVSKTEPAGAKAEDGTEVAKAGADGGAVAEPEKKVSSILGRLLGKK